MGFNRRNPKPETDSESWFQSTKPETRNPKPTRIRLLGGSPDRNSTEHTSILRDAPQRTAPTTSTTSTAQQPQRQREQKQEQPEAQQEHQQEQDWHQHSPKMGQHKPKIK